MRLKSWMINIWMVVMFAFMMILEAGRQVFQKVASQLEAEVEAEVQKRVKEMAKGKQMRMVEVAAQAPKN